MDRRTLTVEELAEMKKYISSRSLSFTEPGIMAEILDHFICKTEEILNQNPSLSFYNAMVQAHESFGVRGFAPIADAWQASIHRQYKQWGKQTTLQMIMSIHGLGLLAFSLLTAQLFWILANKISFYLNGMEFMLAIEIITIIIILTNKPGKRIRKEHPMLFAIASQADFFKSYTSFYLIPILIFNNHTPILARTITIGLGTFFFTYCALYQLRLQRKIASEINTIEEQIQPSGL